MNILSYHVAKKNIPSVSRDAPFSAISVPGWKLESFIFDVFPYANRLVALEAERDEEFAPLKNADGDDSPATCRLLVSSLAKRRLRAAGADVRDAGLAAENTLCEISPLAAFAGDFGGPHALQSLVVSEFPFYLDAARAQAVAKKANNA